MPARTCTCSTPPHETKPNQTPWLLVFFPPPNPQLADQEDNEEEGISIMACLWCQRTSIH